MKVKYRYQLRGYSGNTDDMIYYFDKKSGVTLARRKFTFRDHPEHPGFRSAQKQIYAIQPSREYVYNLTDYISAYNYLPENELKPMRTWTNLYNKLMFALQKAVPETVDLKTITRQQIYEQNLPCKTLKDAIDYGLLPQVDGYERWDKQI
jgi:hypothetical protein